MAITLAQLKTELDLVKTYLLADDFANARKYVACASATLAGLAQSTSDNGTVVAYRQTLDDLRKAVADAQSASSSSSSGSGGADVAELDTPSGVF
ncbi:MAG: hypothetical protein ABFD89_06340 [Bryobacteraceae bacterium]